MITRDTVDILNEPLDPNRVMQLTDAPGKPLYLEGEDIILTMNRIFGYGGWRLTTGAPFLVEDPMHKEKPGKDQVWGCVATIGVLIGPNTWADYGGFGTNTRSGAGPAALEMCAKGAATDALKRAAVHLGDQFGLILRERTTVDQLRRDWNAYHNGKTGGTPPATEKATGDSGPAAPAVPGGAADDAPPAGAPPEEDPSIENYRLALELLRELGWKWSDAWVSSVIGRKPDTAQEAREALWVWLQAVKGRNLDIFIKQCQQSHQKQARAS